MFKSGRKYFLSLFFLFNGVILFSQNRTIDSLKQQLGKAGTDTLKIKIQTRLSWEFLTNALPDSTIQYAGVALKESKNLLALSTNSLVSYFAQKNLGRLYNNFGLAFKDKGIFDTALHYFDLSVKQYEITQKEFIVYHDALEGMKAKTIGNIGVIYYLQGDFPTALKYTFHALSLAEKINDQQLQTNSLGMIASIYNSEGDNRKALSYYFSALKIARKAGDKKAMATHLGNLGNSYYDMAKVSIKKAERDSLLKMALKFHFEALEIDKVTDNKRGIGRHLGNIGLVYSYTEQSDLALKYYLEALDLYEKIGTKSGICSVSGNIGDLYGSRNKLNEAIPYLKRAFDIAKESGLTVFKKGWSKALSDVYIKKGDWENGFTYYKEYIAARDSITNEENTREQTRTEMQYEFDKKEAISRSAQEKKDALARIIIYSVTGGLFLVLILAIYIFRSYRQKQRVNIIISKQKEEVEKQKILVEEKQKEILDSIHYAKRIQESLLPTDKYVERKLKEMRS